MKNFLYNILPRFSRLDFINLSVYVALVILWEVTYGFDNFSFDQGKNLGLLLLFMLSAVLSIDFFLGKRKKIMKEDVSKEALAYISHDAFSEKKSEKRNKVKWFLVTTSFLSLSAIEQFKAGYFSISTNTLFETGIAIFSVWSLISNSIFFLMFILLITPGAVSREVIAKRVEERIYSNKSIILGIIITGGIFLLFNQIFPVPHPLIPIAFVLNADKLAEAIEKI